MGGFELIIDAAYEDGTIGFDAEYQPLAGGSADIRVIPKRPYDVANFQGSQIQTNTALFNVRVSEVAQPVRGDKLIFDETTYTVQGAKYKDDNRYEWLVNTYP